MEQRRSSGLKLCQHSWKLSVHIRGKQYRGSWVPDPLFSHRMAVINLGTWLLGDISVCVCVYVHKPFISDDISQPTYCTLPLGWLFALVSTQGAYASWHTDSFALCHTNMYAQMIFCTIFSPFYLFKTYSNRIFHHAATWFIPFAVCYLWELPLLLYPCKSAGWI